MIFPNRFVLRTAFTALALFSAPGLLAHSGKARFHIVIDTDGAADDLRTLCMMLGNRELEVLAVTTSEGALQPEDAAARVAALLAGFYHEGVPVGAGRAAGAEPPAWRAHSEEVAWGAPAAAPAEFPAAKTLITQTLENEEEKVVFIALGALTNLGDALAENPALADRIDRVIWYSSTAEPLSGPNFRTDSVAARQVLASGLTTEIVSANSVCPVTITQGLVDTIAPVKSPYARKIVRTHRAAPLARLVDAGHLEAWDDLVAVYLFRPELFTLRDIAPNVRAASLTDPAAAQQIGAEIAAILRGKPDSESRVFYGFPVRHDLYAEDVVPIIDETIERHGPSEWRAAVLTNELHGHLGIYATIGVKMGIRAREYFNIGVDDIEVTTYAGSNPPVSCMNDGLQVGTGASVGHGLITVAEVAHPRPEARFTFKDKTIVLRLKPEYADRIRRDVRKGIELYGDLTEPYWQYVRALALQYWRDFDRHEIFDMEVVQ